MIKFENTEVVGWGHAIRGMRNPMNSWDKSDSYPCGFVGCDKEDGCGQCYNYIENEGKPSNCFYIGHNDIDLMKRLRNAGTDHRKFMRMIVVYVDITAPLYWWKEFDTYKIGTVANSCSTMHKIAEKEFIIDDFSHEHLMSGGTYILNCTIDMLNKYRAQYLETKDKKYWWQMIQLLPSSYNQKRTIMMNYEVLANIYKARRNHKLDEWSENIIKVNGEEYTNKWLPNDEMNRGFCDWIKTLPYSELITGEDE